MSRTVLIISKSDRLLDDFYAKLLKAEMDCAIYSEQSQIVIEKDSRVYIDYVGKVAVENGLETIEDVLKYRSVLDVDENASLFMYYISYKDIYLVKKILTIIANSKDFAIDGDSNVILNGQDFVNQIITNSTWDWI